jgi:hypothetical protein
MAGSDTLLNSLHKDAKNKVDQESPARTVQVILASMTHAEAAAAYAETVRAGPRIEAPSIPRPTSTRSAPAAVPQIESGLKDPDGLDYDEQGLPVVEGDDDGVA